MVEHETIFSKERLAVTLRFLAADKKNTIFYLCLLKKKDDLKKNKRTGKLKRKNESSSIISLNR